MNIIAIEVEVTKIDRNDNPISRCLVNCYKDLDTGKVWLQGGEGKWDFVDGTESYFAGFIDAKIIGPISDDHPKKDRVLYTL